MPSVALQLCLAATSIFLAVRIYDYLASDLPPFGYYYDLGANAITTSYIAHAIGSWDDLVDNIGWGSWGNFPNFLFNPTTSYFILVPLELLLKNVWLSLKIVQTAEELVAFGGAAYLYATVIRRDVWCLVAGFMYALLPATALQIRGNIDIGWVFALLPLALAVEFRLVRRFGEAALPLCGIVSSVSGFCFAPEYGVLSSIPLYVLALAAVPRFTLRGAACALLGILCLIGLGAFFIMPTVGGGHLFSEPAMRANSLAAGAELGVYSESWFALGVLLPQEFLLSIFRQFNAGPDLGLVWVATIAMWCLALASTWYIIREPTRVRLTALLLSVILIALALGAYLPFGAAAWALLHAIPGLAFLRTADRFLIVPFLFVVLGATSSLARLSRAEPPVLRALAVALVASSLVLFVQLDLAQHWLANDASLAAREPDLAAVNEVVARNGGRTLSYAYVRGGSQYFTSSYGVPNPTLWFFWDQSLHYYRDGLGGSGIFTRSNVRTVVASPNWMMDATLLPPARRIDAAFPGTLLFARRNGLTVKRVAGRPELVTARTSCVLGGPGLLDWAATIPELQGLSFVRSPAGCRGRTYLDYDPRNGIMRGPQILGFWKAQTLVPNSPRLQDADYPLIVGRTFLSDGWYRNSVDGDDAESLAGATSLSGPTSIPLRIATNAPSAEPVSLLVRLASHGSSVLSMRAANGRSVNVSIEPKRGMQWYTLPVGRVADSAAVTLSFGRSTPERRPAINDWSGVALDRIVAVRGTVPQFEPAEPTDAVLFTLARFSAATPAEDANERRYALHERAATIHARVWLPRGTYEAAVYRPGHEELRVTVSLDGGAASHRVNVRRSAFYRLALANAYTDDRVLAFVTAASRSVPAADAVRSSTYRWAVRMKKRATLEVAWYPDGNWHLTRDSDARPVAPPVRCDLINTCFIDVVPGRYHLFHSWPASFRLGVLLSALASIVACSPFLPQLRPARDSRRIRH